MAIKKNKNMAIALFVIKKNCTQKQKNILIFRLFIENHVHL